MSRSLSWGSASLPISRFYAQKKAHQPMLVGSGILDELRVLAALDYLRQISNCVRRSTKAALARRAFSASRLRSRPLHWEMNP
jgi:hypothetical protein